MGIDVLALIDEKGGDLAAVRASQAKRFAPAELVDDVLEMYKGWVKRESSSYA
jgi:seryl-tRNA synthetase